MNIRQLFGRVTMSADKGPKLDAAEAAQDRSQTVNQKSAAETQLNLKLPKRVHSSNSSIQLPKSRSNGSVTLDCKSLVIVGANGSGKSRLGAWIEEKAGSRAHRISAQRALSIPTVIKIRTLAEAEREFAFGVHAPTWNEDIYQHQRGQYRWKSSPTTSLLDDFEALLTLLFAQQRQRDHEYTSRAEHRLPQERPPASNLGALIALWNELIPHRRLTAGNDKVEVRDANGGRYESRDLSDGERVLAYLIGQVLSVADQTIIIVDEPEIHIHKAIHSSLWDRLERQRPDCVFIYITHDLDFAATRSMACKVWVKGFDGATWDWELVNSTEQLPESLVFSILGSRQNVLLVEGEQASLDSRIFSSLFPDSLIIPFQSCERVVFATKALSEIGLLHQHSIAGIIDRDRRDTEEIEALKAAGVSVLKVAEVENLLCLDVVLHTVGTHLKKGKIDGLCLQVKNNVIAKFRAEVEIQAIEKALARIQFQLNGFGPKLRNGTVERLSADLKDYVAGIDVSELMASSREEMLKVISDADYDGVLRLYNSKAILPIVAGAFGLTREAYVDLALGIINEEPRGLLGARLRAAVQG